MNVVEELRLLLSNENNLLFSRNNQQCVSIQCLDFISCSFLLATLSLEMIFYTRSAQWPKNFKNCTLLIN